ncbi:ATP-grasp domain-containing protein [Streptomyces chilikensis]|uniref:ATP-grasp domain-containing protein n=1 Tax=Streptomyces chilikensis TaxID=1194079 RepID=UPI00140B052A|nr:ATP-grasp domain-containing protein [Streptomyces chilikensis]
MTSRPTGPRLLLVGGATPLPSSVDIVGTALAQARARGIRTHLTGRPEHLDRTPGVTALADEVFAVDPDDVAATLAWARDRRARGEGYDLVLGLRDPVQDAVAACAELFGAPGNPPAVMRRTRVKDLCRAALAAAGLPQPAVRLCAGRADALAFLADTAGPWVVKPRAGMGSTGVRKVTGPADLDPALAGLPDGEPFLLEEYVTGDEYSVEGVLLSDGPRFLAVTAKEKLPPPHFVEVGHVVPAALPAGADEEITREAGRALRALGLRTGVFHVELWRTAHGVVLGEVHVRPGGDWLHQLVASSRPGLELFGMLYDDVLGRPVAPVPPATRAAAVRFLAPPPGRLERITGWDEAAAHPAVLSARLTVSPGDTLRPVRDSGSRAGHLAVGAATPEAARALARELAASVTFEVTDASGPAGPRRLPAPGARGRDARPHDAPLHPAPPPRTDRTVTRP